MIVRCELQLDLDPDRGTLRILDRAEIQADLTPSQDPAELTQAAASLEIGQVFTATREIDDED